MTEGNAQPSAYLLNEFCARYRIGRSLAYREIASGRLKARKVGKRTIILMEDAERWAATLPAISILTKR